MSVRSSSVAILTISIVLAIAIFSFSWVLRPNDESDVLLKARERQRESLINVSQPLETDQRVYDKEKELRESVSESLISDEGFIAAVAEKLSQDNRIYDSFAARFDAYFESKSNELVSRFSPMIESNVKALKEDQDPTLLVDDLIPLLMESVNEHISSILESEGAELVKQYDSKLADLDSRLSSDILRIDNKNEVVPVSEEEIRIMVLSLYADNKADIIKEITNDVLKQLDKVAIEEKEKIKAVSAPVFVSTGVVRDLSDEEYLAERNLRRQELISDIMEKLDK